MVASGRLGWLLGLILAFSVLVWVALTLGAVLLASRATWAAGDPEAGRLLRVLLTYGLANAVFVAAVAFLLVRRWILSPSALAGGGGGGDRREAADPEMLQSHLQQLLGELRALPERRGGKAAQGEVERLSRELRRVYDELARAERLATTGQLASALAHEVGNPIGIIIGFADLLPQEGRAGEYKGKILSEAMRIQGLLRGLLDFARPSPPTMGPTDVRRVVRETKGLVQGQASFRAVEWRIDAEESSLTAEADPRRLKQVLVNLFLNAADAMPGGGRLEVETKREGPHVLVNVSDTGEGIPSDRLDAVFQPFYTTKPGSKGTGLGLAICKRLMEQMHGDIWATSTPGKGSTFHLRLNTA
ncbi:MAG: hypothetical protein HYY13_11380 [Nitrospirae bacterium]|nr:hypothetical protein [Nitrospirota bacterium]